MRGKKPSNEKSCLWPKMPVKHDPEQGPAVLTTTLTPIGRFLNCGIDRN